MLSLTDYLGRPVLDAEGRRIGRLVDLVVGAGEPVVVRLRVRARRTVVDVPWERVAGLGRKSVRLGPGPDSAPVEREGEILLARHVLDRQVLDAAGRHLARVGDVDLFRDGDELRVISIDIGARAVMRRLGLRRLARRASSRRLDWAELRVAPDRGRALQLLTAEAPPRAPRHRYGAVLSARRRAPS